MKALHWLILSSILLAFTLCQNNHQENKKKLLLPIFGEKKIAKVGDNVDTLYHTIGSFTLTNQYG